MKAIISDCSTDIYLTDNEVKEFCKPGEGANTCIWLIVGAEGFECCYLNRSIPLLRQWEEGHTVAKRDGCDKVKNFDPFEKDREVVF